MCSEVPVGDREPEMFIPDVAGWIIPIQEIIPIREDPDAN